MFSFMRSEEDIVRAITMKLGVEMKQANYSTAEVNGLESWSHIRTDIIADYFLDFPHDLKIYISHIRPAVATACI